MTAFNQFPQKVKISIRGSWKPNFNFFESHCDKHFKHGHFAGAVHWLNQGLIAIAQIYRTPDWRCFNLLARPCTVT